jgi:phosphatidylserine/phosphatidylglycerophosphate/cardiolipin synthase-like enzyme
VAGETLAVPAEPASAGGVELQLVRTVPERVYPKLDGGDFTILESYLRALRSARKLIYLENQFLWSPEISEVLIDKLRHPPADDFRLLVLLPAHPNNGGDHTRGQLGRLVEADDGEGRFLACTLHQREGSDPRPVYVHAKIGIVDDRWFTLGSANLNEHSLFNDTEVNIVTCDKALARATRIRLWAEHLERPEDEVAGDTTTVIDEIWRPLAEEQRKLRERGEPQTHRLSELLGVSRRSRRVLGPLNGLFVDG